MKIKKRVAVVSRFDALQSPALSYREHLEPGCRNADVIQEENKYSLL